MACAAPAFICCARPLAGLRTTVKPAADASEQVSSLLPPSAMITSLAGGSKEATCCNVRGRAAPSFSVGMMIDTRATGPSREVPLSGAFDSSSGSMAASM